MAELVGQAAAGCTANANGPSSSAPAPEVAAITSRGVPSSISRCRTADAAKSTPRPAARAGTAAVTAASYVSSGVGNTPVLST